jgi:hypothetical protein
LGLRAGLFPNGFQLVSFLTILSSSILCMCPNHLSLCALILYNVQYSLHQSKYLILSLFWSSNYPGL